MGKDLNSILKSAQFLMSEEGQKRIDFASKNNTFGDDFDLSTNVPSQYKGAGKILNENRNMNMNNENISEEKAKRMGIPLSLLKEIETDNYASGTFQLTTESSGSVLDGLSLNALQPKQQIVEERPRYNPTPQVASAPSMNVGVDYTIIKAIVEECIKRNLEEIKQSILAESTLRRVKLAEGNKIQLVDNKGNLYESTLEFKKNILKK